MTRVKCWGRNLFGELGQNDNLNHGSRNDGGGTSAGQNGICTGNTGNDAKVANEVCTVAGLPFVDLGCYTKKLPCGDDTFKAKFVSLGYAHTCTVITTNNKPNLMDTLKCWGHNSDGQLGQNNTTTIGNNISNTVAGTVAINLDFLHCPSNKTEPSYKAVDGQCLPSCGTACGQQSGGGTCGSGAECDDTENYNITLIPNVYDVKKCCFRTTK